MGVSPDTMRRWADAGRVKAAIGAGGHREIDGADLARLATEHAASGSPPRSGLPGAGQSARNHIAGIVTRVTLDGVTALIELQAGPYRLVSLITREAADDLGLEPGMMADAVVKSTNVSVEVHPHH